MAEETKKKTTRKPTTSTAKKSSSSTTKKRSTTTKPKATTTKKSTSSTTKPKPTTTKKTTTTKKATPRKTTTTKPKTSTSKKAASSTSKTTVKKPTSSTSKTSAKTTKVAPKSVKNVNKSSNLSSGDVKTVKTPKTTTKKKKTKKVDNLRVKTEEEMTTLEVMESVIEGKEIKEKKPLGKAGLLTFAVIFYAIAFFYIYTIVYESQDILQSAIFAFAALFIVFVLMLFNIPRIVIGFFVLPFRRLLKQARQEAHKEIFFSVGTGRIQTTWNKYQTIFTLVLYVLFGGLLLYATIASGINNDTEIVQIVTSCLSTLLVYIVILCSWQYLFNIIPSILDKSIDAKNGFILTLSAVVMVIYVVFLIFDIYAMSEIMIFVLIIGFIALLGVNMNMIVGEINIFSNLRDRKSKVVTRVVFSIFFGFHIYVILYASVVAYSIYNWQPESFVFSENKTHTETVEETYDVNGNEILSVYYYDDSTTSYLPLDSIYDNGGTEITTYTVGQSNIYAGDGTKVNAFYDRYGQVLNTSLYTEDGYACTTHSAYFIDGQLGCIGEVEDPHTYGAFLYWTVVTVSTIGYGDIHPSTDYNIAMIWGGFLGLYGLTFFALSISFVSNIAMEGVNRVREASKEND